MGSSCSIRGGHHRVAPGDYPAARRVLFCGMGRSGKSTLIEWVVNATKTAADNNNTTVTQGGILSTATTVPSPPRTTTTALHLYKDQSLALVDTPNMLELDGQTVVLDASAQDRVAARCLRQKGRVMQGGWRRLAVASRLTAPERKPHAAVGLGAHL